MTKIKFHHMVSQINIIM